MWMEARLPSHTLFSGDAEHFSDITLRILKNAYWAKKTQALKFSQDFWKPFIARALTYFDICFSRILLCFLCFWNMFLCSFPLLDNFRRRVAKQNPTRCWDLSSLHIQQIEIANSLFVLCANILQSKFQVVVYITAIKDHLFFGVSPVAKNFHAQSVSMMLLNHTLWRQSSLNLFRL